MAFNDRGKPFRGKYNNRGDFEAPRGTYKAAPREMYKAICSDCGVETEVPFKPTEGRQVYCRDCLPNHRKPKENRRY